MSELRLMWRNTRMIVLCAISAALYAAVLVPFKAVPLIPGVTEFRPANAIPIVCSFLFGPAAAWGSAIGNMIGDFFGGVSPGDVFGFFGNLAYGYIPYKIWNLIGDDSNPVPGSRTGAFKFVIACLVASVVCADFVGWGDNALALRPFSMLGNIVVLNNMLAAMALSPFILRAVYPRVQRGRMLYTDVMPESANAPSARQTAGFIMLIAGGAAAWIVGNLLSTGYWVPKFLPARIAAPPYDKSVGLLLAPLMLVAVIGLALM